MLLQTKKEHGLQAVGRGDALDEAVEEQGMPSIMIVSLLLEKQEQQKSNKAKVIQQEQNLVGLQ